MKTIQSNNQFFHNIHIGTAAEKTALTTHGVLDVFIETDTDKQYIWTGTVWTATTVTSITIAL